MHAVLPLFTDAQRLAAARRFVLIVTRELVLLHDWSYHQARAFACRYVLNTLSK